jgi:hypothetical protein
MSIMIGSILARGVTRGGYFWPEIDAGEVLILRDGRWLGYEILRTAGLSLQHDGGHEMNGTERVSLATHLDFI